MTDALVSLPPQRPPPPNRATTPEGVTNSVPRRPPEKEESFRIVDTRAKSKQKSQSSLATKQKFTGTNFECVCLFANIIMHKVLDFVQELLIQNLQVPFKGGKRNCCNLRPRKHQFGNAFQMFDDNSNEIS